MLSNASLSGAYTTVTVPGAPTGVTAVGGNASATVSFTPGSTGNGTVSYTVTSSPSALTATGSSSPITVNNLVNGTSYTFTVTATNSAGSTTSTASNSVTPTASTSTPARSYVASGSAPSVRVTYQTGATSTTTGVCYWVGSVAAGQVQTAWSLRLDDMTSNTTGVYTTSGSGTAESTTLNTTLTAGHAYKAWITITQTDGQTSPISGTRFVVPSGRVLYLEDYGAVGDGVHQDGTDLANGVYGGPFVSAIMAMQYGDTLKSKNPGVVLTGVSATGTALSVPGGGLLSSHVGKPIIVYGGGMTDSTANYAFHTTVSSVAGDGKSAVLASPVKTTVSNTKAMVAFPTYYIGHIDMNTNYGPGGWTIDMTGALCTARDPNHAGFNVNLLDITFINVHYQHLNVTQRGSGQNNNDGTFFVNNSSTVGVRILNCYSENSQDAAYLFYSTSDHHVVDCIDDHSFADAFHTTGGSNAIQFIRPFAVYPGDDGFANVGYASDGASGEPYNITWESPKLRGQDWGRCMSAIGCHDVLYTDIDMNSCAGAGLYFGQEGGSGGTMDTHRLQVRRGTMANPNYRRGQSPTATQGSGTSAVVPDQGWLLLQAGQSSYQQSDIRIESVTCSDGRYLQILSYGGTFKDATIVVTTGTSMTGNVSSGTGWINDSTWPQHIDLRNITVPSGSSTAPVPVNAGTNGGS